jgi:ribosomal protein S18 acetylase RimI-like enzyme
MKIYKIAQEYKTIDDEDDDYSEHMDEAWDVFKNNKIRPNRNKDISDIALKDGTVIGAIASGWDVDNNIATFSFDISIDKSNQGMQIGTNLVRQALSRYNNDKGAYIDMGMETEIELEVINVKFGEYLVRQFGFEVVRTLADRLILRKD